MAWSPIGKFEWPILWSLITGVPAFASRWPTFAEVTDKPTYYATDWNTTVANRPSSFPSTIPLVSGLQAALDGKQNSIGYTPTRRDAPIISDANTITGFQYHPVADGGLNTPNGSWTNVLSMGEGAQTNWRCQIAQPWFQDRLYFRRQEGADWRSWREILVDQHMPSGADFNNYRQSGVFRFSDNHPASPGFNYGNMLVLRGANSDTSSQVAIDFYTGRMMVRAAADSTGFTPWRELVRYDQGSANVTGGGFTAQGGGAAYNFQDRSDFNRSFAMYATGGTARFWVSGVGDLGWFDTAGSFRAQGRMRTAGGHFASTGSAVVLSAIGGGVYLRPNGEDNSSHETVITAGGERIRRTANDGDQIRDPRIFVQSNDPGAAAAPGDLWIW